MVLREREIAKGISFNFKLFFFRLRKNEREEGIAIVMGVIYEERCFPFQRQPVYKRRPAQQDLGMRCRKRFGLIVSLR